MGKVIQFMRPADRRLRRPAPLAFAAFGEMQNTERAQLKLLAAFGLMAALVALALQLATR